VAKKIDSKPSNYYQNLRLEMLPYIPKTAKNILELGCGEGMFGSYLRENMSAKVSGIEIETKFATKAKKNLDKVYIGDAELIIKKLPDNSFDVIVVNDVLEHMVDPYSVLKEAKRILRKGGVVVSSIPNMRNFHVMYHLVRGGQWEYVESGILDRTHLRFFTQKSIRNMYERLGYEVVKHEGIFEESNLPAYFKFINTLARGKISDMKYVQFATVAKVKR
jgi:methionine biosynthesis protein MetW